MIILGIDPGLAATGYGVIENRKTQIVNRKAEKGSWLVVEYGCIRTEAKEPKAERLSKIHREIKKLIKKFRPDVVAIEELFFGANAKTAMMVGEARGVVLLACGEAKIDIKEYTPLEIKIALTNYGRAEKIQVQKMVQRFLNLPELPKPDHAADALACAYCCAVGATSKFEILNPKLRMKKNYNKS